MTPSGQPWDELHLSENPAIEVLQQLGHSYVASEDLEAERESLRDVVLTTRLAKALKLLTPWLSEDNVHKAIRAVTGVQAANLIEASEAVHETLFYRKTVEQDPGGGKKGHDIRYFDFDHPDRNELIVTRQQKVNGAKKRLKANRLGDVLNDLERSGRVRRSDAGISLPP